MTQLMTLLDDPQSRPYARLTGALYLSIAVAGAFAIGYVPSQIVAPGDPAATLANMTARQGLYHLGLGADALVLMLEIATLTLLYFLFRPVSAVLSLAAAFARFGMVAVMATMLFFHAGASALADPGPALAAFTADQRAALAGLLLDMHRSGIWIWQLFFALHLALLGWLVLRSGWFPRLFGIGLMVGSTGYLADTLYGFAFPDLGWFGLLRIGLLVIVTLSEVGFALWLTIRGPAPAAS